jgi:hypothetical protein
MGNQVVCENEQCAKTNSVMSLILSFLETFVPFL